MPTRPAMHDLGRAMDTPKRTEASASGQPQKRYPCLHGLTSAQLPGLKDYDVGETVQLMVEGLVKSKSLSEQEGEEPHESIDVEIQKGHLMSDKTRKIMEETGMSKANAVKAVAQESY